MQDVVDILKNIETIYDSDTAFNVLKDFERVIDQLDLYVYKNWDKGELASGPKIERHWVTCTFMWKKDEMPDPMGAKRLLDYDCKVNYIESSLIQPRKIRKPSDMRPGTKKGKLDTIGIWLVEIQMPKNLIGDMLSGMMDPELPELDGKNIPTEGEPADALSVEGGGDSMGLDNMEPKV